MPQITMNAETTKIKDFVRQPVGTTFVSVVGAKSELSRLQSHINSYASKAQAKVAHKSYLAVSTRDDEVLRLNIATIVKAGVERKKNGRKAVVK